MCFTSARVAGAIRTTSSASNSGLVFAVVAALLLALPCASQAQAPGAALGGYDVIMLIDQSGSASGALLGCTDHPLANDPWGHRIVAAERLVTKLGQAAEKAYTRGEPKLYRYSVVEFGDDARVAVDWRSVTYSPGQGVQVPADSLRSLKIANMGFTDFVKGLEVVADQFAKIQYGRDRGEPRGLVVYVVTDGQPYSSDTAYWSAGSFSMNRHWAALNTVIRDRLRERSTDLGAGITIGVIAIDDNNEYWPSIGQRWNAVADKALQVPAPVDARGVRKREQLIGFLDQHFFNDLVVPPPSAVTDRFEVPCFVRKMEVSVFPDPSKAAPLLIQPDGTPLPPSRVYSRVTGGQGGFETIAVRDPEPGEWRLGGTGKVRGSVDFFFDTISLVAPNSQVPVPQQVPVQFRWRAADAETGATFDYSTCGAFDAKCEVLLPTGLTETVELGFVSDGTFESAPDAFVPSPGEYSIRFVGGLLSNGQRNDIIVSAWESMTCSDQMPVLARVVEPEKVVTRFGAGTVSVRVSLESAADGTALDVTDVARGSDPIAEVQFFSTGGDTLSGSVPLMPAVDGSSSELVASVPLRRRLTPASFLLARSDYRLSVVVHTHRVSDDYFFFKVEQ
jgi:hypothetical protein